MRIFSTMALTLRER